MSVVVEECHLAVVTANEDPDQLGQIRVACQALLDGEDQDLPQWIKPYLPWGWFVVPDVGELVEIVAVTGASDDEQPGTVSIVSMNLRWRGTRLWGNTDGDTPTPVPSPFLTNYGKRRGFATPVGHIIWFDDTEGQEALTVQWQNKGGDQASLQVDQNGSVSLTNKNGATVTMDADQKQLTVSDENQNSIVMDSTPAITVTDQNQNSIKLDENGITVTDKNGNTVTLDSSGVTVNVASGAKCVVNADEVDLGGNAHGVGLGDEITNYLTNHTHSTSGPGSPTGPPITPPSGLESTVVKCG